MTARTFAQVAFLLGMLASMFAPHPIGAVVFVVGCATTGVARWLGGVAWILAFGAEQERWR